MKRIGEHAVVIGASMGGLLAARALADFFGTVTVLERDAFPVADIPRKGVPQGKHAHGLLARGRTVIEDFFPGWTDQVVECGGVRGDIAGDVNWIGHGVTIKSAPSELVGLLAARPVLEGSVRRRLLALPNVRTIEHCAVQGLVADESHTAIRGVRARIDNGAERTILADLVIDASGRGSSSPSWLDSFGYARPEEEKIEIGIGYTTRVYRRRPTDLGGKLAIVVAGSGPNWRNGTILFQTEDRWIVSIGGYFGDHAPDDNQMFAAYAGSLPTSDIHDIVAHAAVSRSAATPVRSSTTTTNAKSAASARRRQSAIAMSVRRGWSGNGRKARPVPASRPARWYATAAAAVRSPGDVTSSSEPPRRAAPTKTAAATPRFATSCHSGMRLLAQARNPYALCRRIDDEREHRGYGFRARSLRSRPGMTVPKVSR
jgi:hypothetical protein